VFYFLVLFLECCTYSNSILWRDEKTLLCDTK